MSSEAPLAIVKLHNIICLPDPRGDPDPSDILHHGVPSDTNVLRFQQYAVALRPAKVPVPLKVVVRHAHCRVPTMTEDSRNGGKRKRPERGVRIRASSVVEGDGGLAMITVFGGGSGREDRGDDR